MNPNDALGLSAYSSERELALTDVLISGFGRLRKVTERSPGGVPAGHRFNVSTNLASRKLN